LYTIRVREISLFFNKIIIIYKKNKSKDFTSNKPSPWINK
jgi:hypothetical protein